MNEIKNIAGGEGEIMRISVEIPLRDSEERKKTFKKEFEKSRGGIDFSGTMTIGERTFRLWFSQSFSMTQLFNGSEMSFEMNAVERILEAFEDDGRGN